MKVLNLLITMLLFFGVGINILDAKGNASKTPPSKPQAASPLSLTTISFYDVNRSAIPNTDVTLNSSSSKLLRVPSEAYYISATVKFSNTSYQLFNMVQINNVEPSLTPTPGRITKASQQITTLSFNDSNQVAIPYSTIYINNTDTSVSIPSNASYISATATINQKTYQLFNMVQIENFNATPAAISNVTAQPSYNFTTSLSFYNENQAPINNTTINVNPNDKIIKMPYASYVSATVTIDNKTYPAFTMAKIENFDPNPTA